MEIQDESFGVHFGFGKLMDVVLHIWLKEEVQQFILHVLLMNIFKDLGLLYNAFRDYFYFCCLSYLLIEKKICILFLLFVIAEGILLYSTEGLSPKALNIEIHDLLVIKIAPFLRASLDIRSIMTSLRHTVMDDDSFQLIIIQLLIDIMIIIDSISGKRVDIEILGKRAICV